MVASVKNNRLDNQGSLEANAMESMVHPSGVSGGLGRADLGHKSTAVNGPDAKKPKTHKPIQSVDRALEILDTLVVARNGMALGDISRQMGLNVSTCHHLLMTLFHRGYVTQDRQTRRYRLGNKLFEMQYEQNDFPDLINQAMPSLQELNQDSGEAVHLAVMQADELVTLVKLDSSQAVRVDSAGVGKSRAMHATATGKVLLAYLQPGELEAIVDLKGMHRFTEDTLVTLKDLQQEMLQVRQLGYSEDRNEFQPGVHCIGAPIRDRSGGVVASVSCATPIMRMSPEYHQRILALVRACAEDISEALGYQGR